MARIPRVGGRSGRHADDRTQQGRAIGIQARRQQLPLRALADFALVTIAEEEGLGPSFARKFDAEVDAEILDILEAHLRAQAVANEGAPAVGVTEPLSMSMA